MTVKYPEIKEYILQEIKKHTYKEGQMLPPKRALTAILMPLE